LSGLRRADPDGIGELLEQVAARQLIVRRPTVRFQLEPGDRALVSAGESVAPGTPIAERTLDAVLVDAGRLTGPSASPNHAAPPNPGSGWLFRRTARPERTTDGVPGEGREVATDPQPTDADAQSERRGPPATGKWWQGGSDRRGRSSQEKAPSMSGTLLYEIHGRWQAAAGDHHRVLESPFRGVVRESCNGLVVTIVAEGAAMPAAIAAGESSRGRLDMPRLPEGELWASALDVSRAGGIVVAGSRISAQAIGRARATSIRGLVAASAGRSELRDLRASEMRQRASLAPAAPFGLLVLDGYQRRPIARPVLALLAALAGRDVAIVTDPPLLVFDQAELPVSELAPGWVRVRSGSHVGREGTVLGSAGRRRFRSGVQLEAAVVLFLDQAEPEVLPLADLERFVV
jgi:hypothetical protein